MIIRAAVLRMAQARASRLWECERSAWVNQAYQTYYQLVNRPWEHAFEAFDGVSIHVRCAAYAG